MNVVDKAKRDVRNQKLLNQLSQKIRVKYHKSKDDGWASDIKNGFAHIYYRRCKNPAASLAHELLHIDTQLKGYKRIRIGFSTYDQSPLFSRFMTCIDNELQHQKFFSKFLELGFESKDFYRDSDADTEDYLKHVVTASPTKLIEILPVFFTLIAPGGSIEQDSKDELLSKFYLINNGAFKEKLRDIKEICEEWSASNSYDNIPVIKNIMLVLQPSPNYTWFGFDMNDRPPEHGFFVDRVFEVHMPDS